MSLLVIRRGRSLPLGQLQLLRQAAAGLTGCMHHAAGGSSAASGTGTGRGPPAPAAQLWRYESPLQRYLSTAAESQASSIWACCSTVWLGTSASWLLAAAMLWMLLGCDTLGLKAHVSPACYRPWQPAQSCHHTKRSSSWRQQPSTVAAMVKRNRWCNCGRVSCQGSVRCCATFSRQVR